MKNGIITILVIILLIACENNKSDITKSTEQSNEITDSTKQESDSTMEEVIEVLSVIK